jgi:adenylate cyclase
VAEKRAKRKLSAILSADVQGYSRLMGEDERHTIEMLKACRHVIGGLVQEYRGRVVDSPGDNILAEFGSVVEAVACAVKIQEELKKKNAALPENRRMAFRIGINLGDVIEEEGRIYGDGVNIAARLEALADGGGVCISGAAFEHIGRRLPVGYAYLGEQTVKNIERPIHAYKILMHPKYAGKVMGQKRPKRWRWAAVAAAMAIITAIAAIWTLDPGRPPLEPVSVEKMAFPLPDKPSIAVLPFDNLSADPSQEYIADGISENIITALSHISDMFVIARNSTFAYKRKAVKVQQVAEDLGVRYVLEGSVQREDNRLRITAQLVDAITGRHLWAERYDRHLKDLFALQDDITLKIATAMQVELTEGEQARMWSPPDNFEAWSYLVRAGDFFQRFNRDDNARARELLERAVKLDPGYATAWTFLAWTHEIDAWLGFTTSRTESMKKAMSLAEKAMALDAGQPIVHSLWATIYLTQEKWEKAISEGRKAVALGPNDALSHVLLANTLLFAGQFEEAMALAERAVRLAPYSPDFYLSVLAQAYRQMGRYEDALAMYKKALERAQKNKANVATPLIGLVDVCEQLNRREEAQSFASELLRILPNFNLEGYSSIYGYRNPAHTERILVNLRKAGLPEKPPLARGDQPGSAPPLQGRSNP